MTNVPELDGLLAPSSIAIVGASANRPRIGNRVLANLDRHGYRGQVFVVHEQATEITGHPCHPSLRAIGSVPDVALFAVSADATLDLLAEYAELGGRNAVLLASGFEAGAEARHRRDRLRAIADTHGLNVVGPNTQGLWSVKSRMVLAFGSEAARDDVMPGPVAVIAQSGSLGGAVTRQLLDRGVGVSYFISTGDGTVTDTADYLARVVEDPQVRVAVLYLEGTRDARRLGEALRAARQHGVRVIVLAGGTSAAGRAAASSHTGRMITRPRLLNQLLTQQGAVLVQTMRELVEATRTLALSPVEVPHSAKVAALGISGGMLALMVDACAALSIELATFGPGTLDRLRDTLPAYTSPRNPVDVTGSVVENEALLVDSVAAAIEDPGVGAVLTGLDNRGYDRVIRNAETFGALARAAGKPIVFSLWDAPAGRHPGVERSLNCAGVFLVTDPSESAAPLAWLTPPARTADAQVRLEPLHAFGGVDELTTWDGIGRLAGTLGAKTPWTRVLHAGEDIRDEELTRPPYVVKPVPNRVAHKSDRGLVHLNLLTGADVRSAVKRVGVALGVDVPVLVQEMVTGVEVLVTAGQDAEWGPILTIGTGGKLVELIDDIVHIALPCDEAGLRAALGRLRITTLFNGYRDIPPVDVDALVHTLDRLQRVLLATGGTIAEIELNPLVVGAKGHGVFVIDLLVRAELTRERS